MELYRSSHALLHTSWTEGLPQVLIEAFAAGSRLWRPTSAGSARRSAKPRGWSPGRSRRRSIRARGDRLRPRAAGAADRRRKLIRRREDRRRRDRARGRVPAGLIVLGAGREQQDDESSNRQRIAARAPLLTPQPRRNSATRPISAPAVRATTYAFPASISRCRSPGSAAIASSSDAAAPGVARGDEPRGFADRLADPADVGRHNRDPGGERLDQDLWHPLGPRGVKQGVARAVELHQPRAVGDITRQLRPLGDAELAQALGERAAKRAVPADEQSPRPTAVRRVGGRRRRSAADSSLRRADRR